MGKQNRRKALVGATLLIVATTTSGCRLAVDMAEAGTGPTQGGTLTIVQSADIAPSTFFSQNNPNFSIIRTVFNTLTTYDRTTRAPQPELATSWSSTTDGQSITLRLRDGVTFHSGRPFVADDVAFTIRAVQRKDVTSQLKNVATAITGMKIEDEHTITLTLDHPVSNLFDLFEVMPIVDKDTFADLLAGRKFVGTGPFEVAQYVPGSGVRLTKNTNYWKKGLPRLDAVNIDVQSQSQSMLSSLRSGQSQLALDLAPLDTLVLKNDPGFALIVSQAEDAVYYVASNVTIPPLNNIEVRQGIAWAIDRERILAQALAGIGRVSSLPWAKSSPAFDPVKGATYQQDVNRAKQLITHAGASGASIDVAYNSGFATNQWIAEIVQYDLKNAGLNAQLKPLQAADFFARLGSGEMPGLFVNVHGFGQLSPATLVAGAFPFNAKKNSSNFVSDEYRGIAQQLWTGTNATAATYGPVNDLLLREQFVSDLVVSSHTFAVSRTLKDLNYTMYDYLDLDNAYLAG